MLVTEYSEMTILPSETGETVPQSLFASSDLGVIFDFYVPIVGYKAAFAYLILTHIEPNKPFYHSTIVNRYGFPLSDFALCLNRLVAVGLIKLYINEKDGKRSFHYAVYAPEPPSSFFGRTILAKNLSARLSEEERRQLKSKYLAKSPTDGDDGYKEVPMDLSWFYDFSEREIDPTELIGSVYSRESAKPSAPFDLVAFQNALLNECPDYPISSLSDAALTKIATISCVYDLSPEAIASLFARRFLPERRPVSVYEIEMDAASLKEREAALASRRRGETGSHREQVASALEKMDGTPSEVFLQRMQKRGSKPVESDLKIIRSLRDDLKLSDGAINALLAWVLDKEDMRLPANYVKKIAAAISRKGCNNALDVLNYLKSPDTISARPDPYHTSKPSSVKPKEQAPGKPSPDTADEDDFDWDEVIDTYMRGKES